MTIVATVALFVALGGTDDELERCRQLLVGQKVPDDGSYLSILNAARQTLAEARGETQTKEHA